MTLGKNVLVAIVKGLIITIKHLFTRKVTIQYPEQVRE
jgi:NADH-quinone oxidoreductase subunit I